MAHGLQVWLDNGRRLTSVEWQWCERMLDESVPRRDILLSQLRGAEVVGYCNCGCRTISIRITDGLPRYPYATRVPVEMEIESPPILFLLHIVNGFVSELEVFRGDLQPINSPISLHSAKVTVYAPA